jgi:hypothetical protein
MITAGAGTGPTLLGGCCKRRCKSGVSGNRARTVSSTVPGVTEPDAPGPSPSRAADSHDALPYAGQVVRRVLLRRNIVIDAETAQLVAAAVQAALQTGTPPVAGPGPACSRRWLRAAVLIPAHTRAGERRGPGNSGAPNRLWLSGSLNICQGVIVTTTDRMAAPFLLAPYLGLVRQSRVRAVDR